MVVSFSFKMSPINIVLLSHFSCPVPEGEILLTVQQVLSPKSGLAPSATDKGNDLHEHCSVAVSQLWPWGGGF